MCVAWLLCLLQIISVELNFSYFHLPQNLATISRSQSTDDYRDERRSSHDGSMSAKKSTVDQKKTHWSQLEPLSSNPVSIQLSQFISLLFSHLVSPPCVMVLWCAQVKGDGGASLVNPADGDLDEAAEREAFQAAVLEWRQGNAVARGPVTIVRDGRVVRAGAEPMSDSIEDFSSSFGLKSGGGSGGGTSAAAGTEDDGMWKNPFGGGQDYSESPRGGGGIGGPAQGHGGSLSHGTLDEESEHAVSAGFIGDVQFPLLWSHIYAHICSFLSYHHHS